MKLLFFNIIIFSIYYASFNTLVFDEFINIIFLKLSIRHLLCAIYHVLDRHLMNSNICHLLIFSYGIWYISIWWIFSIIFLKLSKLFAIYCVPFTMC